MNKNEKDIVSSQIQADISEGQEKEKLDIRKTVEYLEYGFKVVICPICENETLDDFFICQHCGWEYDGSVKEDDYSSANKSTVSEYRAGYKKFITNKSTERR